MNKKILLAISGIFFSLSLISCVSTKPESKITETYQISEVKTKSSKYEIDAEYPQFDALEYTALNEAIKKCYNDCYRSFETSLAYEGASPLSLQYAFDFKYEIYDYKNLKSVLLTSWSYTGGAHGNTLLFSYCFDKTSQRFVTASEASGIPISQIALKTRMQLTENPDIYVDEWFIEGTDPLDENYNTFVMTDKGLIVYFEPYRIAPYAVGILEATIK